MIFDVNSEEFARAIKPSFEVANNVCMKDFKYGNLVTLEASKDKIVILAYNGAASLISNISSSNFGEINYSCKEEGKVTVYAEDMIQAITTIPTGQIEITTASGELIVKFLVENRDNKKYRRTIATIPGVVSIPNLGSSFVQNVSVDRELFVNGVRTIIFAPAIEEKMHNYKSMLFEAIHGNKQMLRFSAGTGGRFAIKSIETRGEQKIIDNDQESRIIFPKENLKVINSILSQAESSYISIKVSESDPKNDSPEQVSIYFDDMVLCIYGLDYLKKYPDMTPIINYNYPNRIYSDLKDWVFAVGGVQMTYRDHLENIHNTEVLFEVDESRFLVTPKTVHLCTSPVPVDDKKSIAKGDKIWFRCNSQYLQEMVTNGGKSGEVQLNFESQSILEDISSDKPKQMKPVLVKFAESINDAKSVAENFYMFFTVSTLEHS